MMISDPLNVLIRLESFFPVQTRELFPLLCEQIQFLGEHQPVSGQKEIECDQKVVPSLSGCVFVIIECGETNSIFLEAR